jgi:hypothetical protein
MDRASSSRLAAPGTTLELVLDEPVDTVRARPGQVIALHTLQPLRATGGALLASEGARVTARVISVGSAEAPQLRLGFDTIDANFGRVDFPVAIVHAQSRQYAGPTLWRRSVGAESDPYDYFGQPYTYGLGPQSLRTNPAESDVPWLNGWEQFQPREIVLDKGARVTVRLERPLGPPAPVAP